MNLKIINQYLYIFTRRVNLKKNTEFFIIVAMILGIFMASLDNTIVSSSINKVIEDLGGFDKMSWVFTAYILASTSTMLVFGKLSDIFGRKLFFLIGVALFLIGSSLCGMSENINQLILFRAIQGIGSGALLPISFTIIFSIFNDPSKAAKYTGVFAAVFGLSSVLGPQLGTWISDSLSWRWCFYVNVPLGLISFFTLLFALKETKAEKKPKIDYLGTLFLIITTISLMLVFEWGGKEYAWDSSRIISLGVVSLIGLVVFIFVEKHAKEPILPLHLFKNKVITISSFIVFCQGVLMFSAITYIPIFAVGVLGKEGSNGLLTPMMVSVMVGASLGGILISKFKFRTFYVFVMSMSMIISYFLYLIGPSTPYYKVVLLMVFLGSCGIGPLMSVAQNAVANSIPKEFLGIANSLVAFWRNIGGIFGASIMATIVNNYLIEQIKEKMKLPSSPSGAKVTATPESLLKAGDTLPPEVAKLLKEILAGAINHGFLFALFVCSLGLFASLFIGNAKFVFNKKTNE